MCSRCRTSPGASEHITSIASWSPRKSEPLTVSYACECQSSSTEIAALIPPAAATECERTGWTLLMIATLAPSRAAASAARWPARPAPMIRTSCAGMAVSGGRGGAFATGTLYSGRTQGPADLRQRHHALQDAILVDGDHRAQAAQSFGPQQGFQRRLLADPHRQVLLEHV